MPRCPTHKADGDVQHDELVQKRLKRAIESTEAFLQEPLERESQVPKTRVASAMPHNHRLMPRKRLCIVKGTLAIKRDVPAGMMKQPTPSRM